MLLDNPQDSAPPPPPPSRTDRSDAAHDSSNDAAPADTQKADASAPAKDTPDSKPADARGAKDTRDSQDAKSTDGTKIAKITIDGKAIEKKADTSKTDKKAGATKIEKTDATAVPVNATPQIPTPVAPTASVVQIAATMEAKPASDADQLAAAAAAGPGGPKIADAKPAQAKGDAPAKTTAPTAQVEDGAQIEAGKDANAAAAATTDHAPAHHGDTEKLLTAGLDAAANPAKGADLTAAANANNDAAQNLQVQASTNQTTVAPVQTAATTLAAPAAAVPVAGIAVEIAKQADAGNSHFAIRLDPPDLGRIDVRLDVDKSGNITTHVTADRQDTLDLLRRDQTQLERSLQDAGLKTGDNSMQFSLRDQSFAGRDDNGNPQNTTRLVVPDDAAAPVEAVRQSYGRLLGMSGGLDIRV